MAAVLGGTNSLHTNALDEVLALPSERAAQIALRTQQVIAEETGVLNVADPLGGSWYVEALTDEIERQAEAIFARIQEMGGSDRMMPGLLRGIEDGWFCAEIADSAFVYQTALEKGDKRVVGVNTLTGDVGEELAIMRVSHEVELEQRAALSARRPPAMMPRCGARWPSWSTSPGVRATRCRRCWPRSARKRRWARSARP